MTNTRITHLPAGSAFRSLFERSAVETGFLLTVDDRLGIERLLRHRRTRNSPNPPLLNGLLRHKLRISRGTLEPASPDLVVAGSHVTYMISGEGARSGVLSMNPAPVPGHILVASLLGATLIGMRKLQKVRSCGTTVRSKSSSYWMCVRRRTTPQPDALIRPSRVGDYGHP